MNKWATFALGFNQIASGKYFTRKELREKFPEFTEEQVDNYRLHVERAGFIRRNAKTDHGIYKKVRNIPETMGWRECVRSAYPNRIFYD